MQITATEFKVNFGKYLEKSQFEDIYITKNGKTIAKICNPNGDRIRMAKSLIGILEGCEMTAEEIRDERISLK